MSSGPEPTAASVPGAERSTLRRTFFGKDGLRAGWGLLVFVAICAALATSTGFVTRKVVLAIFVLICLAIVLTLPRTPRASAARSR